MAHEFPKLISVMTPRERLYVAFDAGPGKYVDPRTVIAWGLVEGTTGHRWLEPLVSADEEGCAHAVYAKKFAQEKGVKIRGLFCDYEGSEKA